MPKVTKRGTGPKRGDSVWDRVIPVSENVDNGMKINIFGRNGTGKTSLGCTWPKPLLLVGLEDGTKSVRSEPGVKFVRVKHTSEFGELSEGVVSRGYKTVVIDTATSLQDMVLKELCGWSSTKVQLAWGTVTQTQYRERAEKTKELLRLFLDIAEDNPVNVIVLAQEKDHTPRKEEGATSDLDKYDGMIKPLIASSLGKSTMEYLCDSVDYICHTFTRMEEIEEIRTVGKGPTQKKIKSRKQTDKKEFCLRMDRAHPIFTAKIRADRRIKIPDVLVNPSYERFMKALVGKLED